MKLMLLAFFAMMAMLDRLTLALMLDITVDKLPNCDGHARLALFAAFHYDEESIQEVLLPLIFSSISYFNYFAPVYLDEERSEALWNYAKSRPYLHWMLLPFEHVMRNQFLVRLIGMDLESYHPGVICLNQWPRCRFSFSQLWIILKVLGPHPEYCGDYGTYSIAKQLHHHNDWELSADVDYEKFHHPPDGLFIFQVIDNAFRSSIEQKVINTIDMALTNKYLLFIVEAYNRIVQQAADWRRAYQFLLAELKVQSTSMSKIRKMLWQLKLLFLVLKSASRCEEFVPIPGEKLQSLATLIRSVVEEVEYSMMAPFLTQELSRWLGNYGGELRVVTGGQRSAVDFVGEGRLLNGIISPFLSGLWNFHLRRMPTVFKEIILYLLAWLLMYLLLEIVSS